MSPGYTSEEMMVVTAARQLSSDDTCFVGIGTPSAACNLARLTHSPGITLIYESGTIGTRPDVLPLSIGDGELCETALTTVSVPEMFQYWLQAGRISIGFLGAAQIDRFANINTTVIGGYHRPEVRLPGGGGAPEIASFCEEIFVIMPHSPRAMVPEVDFVTSFGFGSGGSDRADLGLVTQGPTLVITDLCLMRPDPETKELTVASLHPGVDREQVRESTGWGVAFGADLGETPPPEQGELEVLRDLMERTAKAHAPGHGREGEGS
ncbi:MAG: CoA-transferase subunit beta [Actinobacteria bacterium]|nr:CoA-transferase subunit beta [Actinomycetota bacterium]